jgi:2-polyprenyl-3-methyl-5-hydroxy-6-metoxy-1,4-benzoquinol methylase
MSSSYRNTLNQYLANLELAGETIIDIGGAQESLSKRVKRMDVKNLIIADLPEPHADSPKPAVVLDLNEPLDTMGVNKDAYELKFSADIVTCFEVFDYVYLPGRAMKTIAMLLKDEDSRAYVSFPTVYPQHQPVGDDALRYMPSGVEKLAKHAGLVILDTYWRRPESKLFDQFFRTERMRAAKHVDHDFTGMIVTFKVAPPEIDD